MRIVFLRNVLKRKIVTGDYSSLGICKIVTRFFHFADMVKNKYNSSDIPDIHLNIFDIPETHIYIHINVENDKIINIFNLMSIK